MAFGLFFPNRGSMCNQSFRKSFFKVLRSRSKYFLKNGLQIHLRSSKSKRICVPIPLQFALHSLTLNYVQGWRRGGSAINMHTSKFQTNSAANFTLKLFWVFGHIFRGLKIAFWTCVTFTKWVEFKRNADFFLRSRSFANPLTKDWKSTCAPKKGVEFRNARSWSAIF